MASPLAGRRVVVTRAPHQSAALTRLLTERDAIVEHVPLVEIADPADGGAALTAALRRIDSYDWLVVTSPNGATRVADAMAAAAIRGAAPRVAAVGRATEAALGRPADLIPRRATGAALVDEFPRGEGRVLVAQADRAGATVADGLRALGWTVDVCVAYRTLTTRPDDDARRRAQRADAVLFASGSAVHGWVAAFGPTCPAVVVVIGPSTAAAARRQNLQVTSVAADQSVESMVGALERAFADRR